MTIECDTGPGLKKIVTQAPTTASSPNISRTRHIIVGTDSRIRLVKEGEAFQHVEHKTQLVTWAIILYNVLCVGMYTAPSILTQAHRSIKVYKVTPLCAPYK